MLISDKTDFRTKTVINDKEKRNVMIVGSIQKEDMTFINIYAPILEHQNK